MKFTSRQTLLATASLLGAVALVGCGGGASTTVAPPPPAAGLLKQATALELETTLKAGFTTIAQSTTDDALALTGSAPASGSVTGTYTQEVNVDEFDAVRYDGEHLYIAPRRFVHCCFLAADGGAGNTNPPQSSIRILATDPAQASASEAGTIDLDDGISIQGMYVVDDSLFALTAQSYYGAFGSLWADLSIWAPERLGYQVYDTTDKSAPVLATEVEIDGVFVESRRIGNTVYIISRYSPSIDNIVHAPQSAAEVAANETILANVALEEMLPTITIDGNVQTLVDPVNCYVTNDDAEASYPVLMTITAVPVDDPTTFRSTCYTGSSYGVYVSESAIYVPQIVDYELPENVTTRIHKFALAGSDADYRGSADIRGQVWRGGQYDFRMSEYNGDLRVLASDRQQSSTDNIDHLLYVLRESATEPALDVIGELPNADRPEAIGKPNEQLYGVRFLGERAFAVTFEQIDPLYAIDLADPTDPFIAGELEVTGVSDFLHPVSDDLLLGLGSSATGAIKLEIFDVSDLAAPVSRSTQILGERGSYSEAVYDRHAFTYQADVNGVDRFTIPAHLANETSGFLRFDIGLHLFELHDKDTPALATIVDVGRLSPPIADPQAWSDRNRAFIHDDTVYYIERDNVWSAFWNAPTMLNGPL